jgi:hypothetical protein
MPTYARCKSDLDTKWWDHESRTAGDNWNDLPTAPATVSLSVTPAGHAKDHFEPPAEWLDYIAALNGGKDSKAYKGLLRKGGSWNNIGKLSHPRLESIAFWGAVLQIEEVVGRYARVKTMNARGTPPNPNAVNYQNRPELVHQFTAIDQRGRMRLMSDGVRAYSVMVSTGDLYVPLDRVEFFPKLPREVYVKTDLNTYATPPANGSHNMNAARLVSGQTVRIVRYAVRGPEVWARTLQGWIALCIGSPSRFLTSWEMKTNPAK